MNPTDSAVAEWRGSNAVDSDGEKIGTIEEIYLDNETGQPEWAGRQDRAVRPKASLRPGRRGPGRPATSVQVPYDKQQVKDAPSAEADGELSQDEEASSTATTASSTPRPAPTPACPRATAPRPTTAARSATTPAARTPTTR